MKTYKPKQKNEKKLELFLRKYAQKPRTETSKPLKN